MTEVKITKFLTIKTTLCFPSQFFQLSKLNFQQFEISQNLFIQRADGHHDLRNSRYSRCFVTECLQTSPKVIFRPESEREDLRRKMRIFYANSKINRSNIRSFVEMISLKKIIQTNRDQTDPLVRAVNVLLFVINQILIGKEENENEIIH